MISGALLYVLRTSRLLWDPAERAGAWGLGRFLKVPCNIGRLSGDPLRAVQAENITIGPDKASPTGQWIDVQRVSVHHSLLAMVRRVPPAEAVKLVEAEGVRVYAHRSADGKWNLQKLVPKPKVPKKPPPRFRGRVIVRNLKVYYRDDTVSASQGGPLRRVLEINELHADFSRYPKVRFAVRGAAPEGGVTSLTIHGRGVVKPVTVDATFACLGIDLAAWTKLAPLPAGMRFADGSAAVTGSVRVSSRKRARLLRYSTTVSVSRLKLFTPGFNEPLDSSHLNVKLAGLVTLPVRKRGAPRSKARGPTGAAPARASLRPTVSGTATLTGVVSRAGAVAVAAAYDTKACSVTGTLSLQGTSAPYWLNALRVNRSVQMTSGETELDTHFAVKFPAAQPLRLTAHGTLGLAHGRLQPPGVRRPLANVRTQVDYQVEASFGKEPVVVGTATVTGSLAGVSHYQVRSRFDTRAPSLGAHVLVAGAHVPALLQVFGADKAFRARDGRVEADMNLDFNRLRKSLAFSGEVRVTGLSGRFAKLPHPFAPLEADLYVDGTAPLNGRGTVTLAVSCRRPSPQLGAFTAALDYRLRGGGITVDFRAPRIQLPFWAAMVLPREKLGVEAGIADSHFTLSTKPRLAYTVTGAFQDLTVRVPALRRQVTRMKGTYEAAPDLVKLTGVTAALADSFFVADGTVENFSAPQLDFVVRGERLNLAELLALAPNADDLPEVAAAETGDGEFQVNGSLDALNIAGEARLPALSVSYRNYGTFRLRPAPVTVAVNGVTSPAPVLAVHGEGVRIDLGGLNRSLLGMEEDQLAFSQEATLSFTVTGSTKTPRVEARLSVPSLRLGDTNLSRLTADLAYADKQLALTDVRVVTATGDVTLTGTVGSPEDSQVVDLRGTLTDFDLAVARPWLGARGLTVAGRTTGPWSLSGTVAALHLSADLSLAAVRLLQHPTAAAPPRRFAIPSGGATLELLVTTREDKRTISGEVTAQADAVSVQFPADDPGRELKLATGRVAASLRLDPKTLTADRIEADAFGGHVTLTRFRYGLQTGGLSAHAVVSSLQLAELADFTKRKDLTGTAGFTGEVQVVEGRPVVTGRIRAAAVKLADSPPAQGAARLRLTWPEVRLDEATFRAAGFVVTAGGMFRVPAGDSSPGLLDLRVAGGGPLDKLAASYHAEQLGLAGSLSFDAALSGTVNRPAAVVHARLEGGKVRGIPVDRFVVAGSLDGDTGKLETLAVDVGGAEFRAEGEMKPGRNLAVRFALDPLPLGLALKLAGMTGPVAGTIRATGQLGGTLSAPSAEVRLDSSRLSLDGKTLGRLSGRLVYRHNGVELHPFTWRFNGGRVVATGRLPLPGRTADASPSPGEVLDCNLVWTHMTFSELRRVGEQVALLLADNDRPVTALENVLLYFRKLRRAPEASLAGGVTLRGTWRKPAVTEASFSVTGARIGADPLPEVHLRASYAHRRLLCKSFEATLADMRAELTGRVDFDHDTSLNLEVRNFPLALINPWLPGTPQLGGLGDVFVVVRGPTESPEVEGSVEITEPALRNAVFDSIRVNHFVLKNGGFTIDPGDLLLLKNEHLFSAGCFLPVSYKGTPIPRDKPFHASVRLKQGDLRLFRELFPSLPTMLGGLEAELVVAGTLASPELTGRIAVQDANVELPGFDSNLHGLTGEVLLTADRRVVFSHLTAMLSTAPADTTILPQFRKQSLKLTGDIRLTDEGLRHPLKNRFNVALRMNDLDIQLADTSPLTHVNSLIRLFTRKADGRVVVALENFSGRGDRNSGPLLAKGVVVLPEQGLGSAGALDKMRPDVTLTARNLTLTRVPYGQITMDAELRFGNDPLHANKPVLSGSVDVHDTDLSPPKSRPAPEKVRPLPAFPNLDLFVNVGDKVQVTHPALTALIRGGVQISGTPNDILVTGTLASERGVVQFPRAPAQIQQADIDIFVQNDPVTKQLVPRIWVSATATAEVDNHAIDIRMRGPLNLQEEAANENQFELYMSSQPPLTQEQIYALLIGTTPAAGTSGTSLQEMVKKKFQNQMVGLFATKASELFTRQVRDALGLDRLDLIWKGEEQRFSELAAAKQFGNIRLEVRKMLGQSALNTAYTINYRLARRFAAEYEQDEYNRQVLRIKFRFNFGT